MPSQIDLSNHFRTVDYAKLVLYSFGFTKTITQGNYRGGEYLTLVRFPYIFHLVDRAKNGRVTQCFDAASSAVKRVLERLAPLGLLKYSPDAWFEYAAFSAAFLIKVNLTHINYT